jgi:outer membrane immunogenic protein
MRTLLTALLTIVAIPALAADLPAKVPVRQAPVAVFSWAGCYIGGHIGWARAQHDLSTSVPEDNDMGDAARAAIIGAGLNELSDNGFIGGGQIGCNFQAGRNLVWGVEADFSATGLKSERDTGIVEVEGRDVRSIDSVKVSWLSTVRGRIGIAFDQTLIYATGGVAIARIKASKSFAWDFTDGCPIVSGLNECHVGSVSDTSVGWTVGGGLEFALTGNWSIKGEYLFVRLGDFEHTTINRSFEQTAIHKVDTDLHIARVGLNYRF